MSGWMNERVDEWMNEWTNEWMSGWMKSGNRNWEVRFKSRQRARESQGQRLRVRTVHGGAVAFPIKSWPRSSRVKASGHLFTQEFLQFGTNPVVTSFFLKPIHWTSMTLSTHHSQKAMPLPRDSNRCMWNWCYMINIIQRLPGGLTDWSPLCIERLLLI